MLQFTPWILALLLVGAVLGAGLVWAASQRGPGRKALPRAWTLSARPIFTSDERHFYRVLRAALPQHVVLSKLPLVRFCQPTDPHDVRYWYELLGAVHVSFAVCTANGRVLAAIDLDTQRAGTRRSVKIKEHALSACRVRYVRYLPDDLPSAHELQQLVPPAPATRAPPPGFSLSQPASVPFDDPAARRSPRPTLWHDSASAADAYFGRDDIGGVVVDPPAPTRH